MRTPSLPPTDVPLHRVATTSIRIGASGEVTVEAPDGTWITLGPRGLIVLDVFSRPRTVAEALGDLRESLAGAQDFIDITDAVAALFGAGVLVTGADVSAASGGWSDPSIHVAMLGDRARTSAYLEAIRRAVGPEDVVLDLGTGSGVLATAAAQAGARHVYAVEASGIASTARAVFEVNGVADRVTILPGWSTQIELPERATVLVSETLGDEPLGERVLEALLDARRRLLVLGAAIVPRGLRVFAYPVSLPASERFRWGSDPSVFEDWRSWYGVDLSPLRAAFGDDPRLRMVRAGEAADWEALAEPCEVAAVDFAGFSTLMVDGEGAVRVGAPGRIDAIATYWELALDDEASISTRPVPGSESHWRTPVWVLSEPLEVKADDELTLGYRYRVPGHPDGVSIDRVR